MKNETKAYIRAMLEQDVEKRKVDLDRVLLQGEDGKTNLEKYRAALLALYDFQSSERKGAV